MRNNIKKIAILSVILCVISFLVIMFMGKTYTITYTLINSNDYKLSVEEESGKVEILDEKVKDNKYIVKVKSKKAGKVYLYLDYGEIKDSNVLYIHKNMVITDNTFFGKSTGSEVIPISISIILLYSLYLLIKKYRSCIKENIYQYKNIAYLGLIIYIIFCT